MSSSIVITFGKAQVRTLCFGLVLIVTSILSLALELLGNDGAIVTGLPPLTLIQIAELSRAVRALGLPSGLGSLGSLFVTLLEAGEAALAFVCISLLTTTVAIVVGFSERDTNLKKPTGWFLASGFCAIIPIAVAGVATSETLGSLSLAAAFYTSILQMILGIAFAVIEYTSPLEDQSAQAVVADKI